MPKTRKSTKKPQPWKAPYRPTVGDQVKFTQAYGPVFRGIVTDVYNKANKAWVSVPQYNAPDVIFEVKWADMELLSPEVVIP